MSEVSELDGFLDSLRISISGRHSGTAKSQIRYVDSDNYKMHHKRRGKALIFNHFEFDQTGLGERSGTMKDAVDLKKTFTTLDFDVHSYEDLKYGKIYDILQGVSDEDHEDADCLLVVVMTHGEVGVLHARDQSYPVSTLWSPFIGNKCPSLVGKPKIFLIQACRGQQVDSGTEVETDSSKFRLLKLPNMADILVMYSTAEGHYSFRSPTVGSWFIQSFCLEMAKRAETRDLMTILTFTNRRIATEYESNSPTSTDFHRKKQVGSIVSSLTKLVYFNE